MMGIPEAGESMQIRLDPPGPGACEHVDAREEISVALRLLREELDEPARPVVELDRAEASAESIEVPIFVSEQALPVAVEIDRRSQTRVAQSDAIALGPDDMLDEPLDRVPRRRTGLWLIAAALVIGFAGWGIATNKPEWLRNAGFETSSTPSIASAQSRSQASPTAAESTRSDATPAAIDLAANEPVAVGSPDTATPTAAPAAPAKKARTSKQRRSKRRKAVAKKRSKASPTTVAPATSSRLPSTPTAVPYPT